MLPLLSNDARIPKFSEKCQNIDWYQLINLVSKKMFLRTRLELDKIKDLTFYVDLKRLQGMRNLLFGFQLYIT